MFYLEHFLTTLGSKPKIGEKMDFLQLPKDKKVVYFKKDRIAYIVLNRPEKINAIDIDMANTLAKIWDDIRDDEEVWAVVLTGAGNNFSSGFDISVINEALPLIRSNGYKMLQQSNIFGEDFKLTPSMHNLWKPVVAVLDGNVNGAGMWLALESDIRIATPETKIGLFEGRIGYPVE
ncbi:MAG: enoyl-CoA hydratase/isomerase family protein, partial [Thermoplasmata archaeon]